MKRIKIAYTRPIGLQLKPIPVSIDKRCYKALLRKLKKANDQDKKVSILEHYIEHRARKEIE